MKIISCKHCGVVVDADRIKFPRNFYLEDGTVDKTKCMWDDYLEDYIPATSCPVCNKFGLTYEGGRNKI
jgi:hypothetical protein